MEFPNTNIVHNVPRLPNSSVNHWGGQSIRTHPYWPQPAHSLRQHSPTRAITQRFLVFIRYPEPQLKGSHSGPQPIECHVFHPYPEPQPEDTFQAPTYGTTSKPTIEISQKHCRQHISCSTSLIWYYTIIFPWSMPLHFSLLRLKALVLHPKPVRSS